MTITLKELSERLEFPKSAKPRTVLNYAIRQQPGGSGIMAALERLKQMQHGRVVKDPVLNDLIQLLEAARQEIARAVLGKEETE